MVFTAGRMIKNAADKNAMKNTMKLTYPLITINLREEVQFLQKLNFRDPAMQFLNLNEFNTSNPQLYDVTDFDFISKLNWYDLGLFALSVIPVSTRTYGNHIYLRFLTMGKNLPQSYNFQIYSSADEEVFLPGFLTLTTGCKISIAPMKLSITDFRMNIPYLKEYFTMLFGIGEQQILKIRVKVEVEPKQKLATEYLEIKDSNFYGMTQMPYITPGGSQRIILEFHKKGKKKLKDKKIIPLRLDGVQRGEINQEWINDFVSLSEYW